MVTLQNSRLPTTWQHGDAHPWNVFATDDGLRLFDFGDSQWAHALEVLRVPHGWISEHPHIAWPEVERTYAEVWDVEPDEIADGMAAAALTHPVNRTLTWWWCLRDATAAEWHEWGEAPVYHLRGVLGRGT